MATVSRHRMPFHRRLFISTTSLFAVYLFCFIGFQYSRERSYKVEALNDRLQLLNTHIAEISTDSTSLSAFVASQRSGELSGLRVTIVDTVGNVVFDSYDKRPVAEFANHADRPEIAAAIRSGTGYTIRRLSESTDEEYFYSALRSGDTIVRSALPYELPLREVLRADSRFIWFMVAVALLIASMAYALTRRMGNDIDRLRLFAQRADRGESIDDLGTFTSNELGEISNHIVRIYTQLRQTKEALENEHDIVIRQEEEQVRIKKQLTQNINHELKTPVSSLQGYLETIIDNPSLSDEKKTEFITKSYNQVVRLAHLLGDISTITRMDEASDIIEKESLCLNDIVSEVFADALPRMESKGVRAKIMMPEGVIITGNNSLLRSIFANLLDNALAYSGCDTITLNVERTGNDRIDVTFADNGVGVADEHLPRIFERFYRVDKGRSRKAGGTGLGLSIVKNAVLLHGGNIAARNCENGGLQFVFSLNINS